MGFGARFEDVEGAREEEGKLEGRAEGRVGWLGGEDGDVEGVVLGSLVMLNGGAREEDRARRCTFLPITPRQAIEGIAAIVCGVICSRC